MATWFDWRRTIWLALVFSSVLCACVQRGDGGEPAVGQDMRLTLLHTSDIHSRLFPFELAPNAGDRSLGLIEENAPFGGVARLGYLIRRERTRAGRVLHLDSGDCFQGAPIFNARRGEPEIRFMSLIGLDAAVIGNHEFDSGVTNLITQLEDWAAYETLAANYVFPDPKDPNKHRLGTLAEPFAIYNLDGLRVAVIGMANLGSLSSIGEGGNSLSITPTERNETVRDYVGLLHNSVDLIIVLSHLGLTEDEELLRGYERVVWRDRMPEGWKEIEDFGDGRALAHVPGVRGIDLVLGGHLHVVLNPPKQVIDRDGRTVVIAHSGAFAKFLGRLDVIVQDDEEFGGKRVVSHKYQVFPVDERLAAYEDPQITEMLENYLLELNSVLDLKKVIAFAPSTVLRNSHTGNGDSALGNIVTESMRLRRGVDAEFSVTNTLGIRDNFYAGPITMETMFNVFPFENSVTVMHLSGAEIQEMADFIASRSASRGCQSQAQVSGMSFTMNCGQVLANQRHTDSFIHPGEDVRINGVPIDPDASYKMATNDYIAGGGSGFRVLKRNTTKIDTNVSLRDALIDYLGTLQRCADYEAEAGICDKPDDASQGLCREIGGVGRIPRQPGAKGAFADVPCVVGHEDGRIKRKTSQGLGELPDERGDEVGP